MLKIAGGTYRSRVIETPASLTVPTKSMVREAVANALAMDFRGAKVLDLFAGSGALGLEALSRGAEVAYFVDSSPEAFAVIEKNIATLKAEGKAFCGDFDAELASFKNQGLRFDIVFLDPPYAMKDVYRSVPERLVKDDLLSEKGIVVLEFEGEVEPPFSLFQGAKRYHYGRTDVWILRR
jgi:16S rRNA (guanine966-N2)-methyltransferase